MHWGSYCFRQARIENHCISIATKYKRKWSKALLSAGTCSCEGSVVCSVWTPAIPYLLAVGGARAAMDEQQGGGAKSKGRSVNAGVLRTLFLARPTLHTIDCSRSWGRVRPSPWRNSYYISQIAVFKRLAGHGLHELLNGAQGRAGRKRRSSVGGGMCRVFSESALGLSDLRLWFRKSACRGSFRCVLWRGGEVKL